MTETNMPTATDPAPRRARRSAETDAEILAGTGYEHLPQVYVHMTPQGTVQVQEPYWVVTAQTFLGVGREATLLEEGTELVFTGTPNGALAPKNRAAAIMHCKWRNSLPAAGVPIEIGDMAEAAQTLGADPDVLKLNKISWGKAVAELAVELRRQREGKDYREVPAIGHNFANPSSSVAPILGGRVASRSEGSFGVYGNQFGNTDPAPVNSQVRRLASPGEQR